MGESSPFLWFLAGLTTAAFATLLVVLLAGRALRRAASAEGPAPPTKGRAAKTFEVRFAEEGRDPIRVEAAGFGWSSSQQCVTLVSGGRVVAVFAIHAIVSIVEVDATKPELPAPACSNGVGGRSLIASEL